MTPQPRRSNPQSVKKNLMTGLELVENARKVKAAFGPKSSKKFAGASAVETLRHALATEGIASSSRDVFIRGIGLEIDLVIPHQAANPELGLVYEPHEVAVALEIKRSGCFGGESIQKIKNDFRQLKNAGVKCAYVSFEDRRTFKWVATKKNLGGCECFTLAWHKKTDGPLEPTQDWNRLLTYLRKQLRRGAVKAPAGLRRL